MHRARCAQHAATAPAGPQVTPLACPPSPPSSLVPPSPFPRPLVPARRASLSAFARPSFLRACLCCPVPRWCFRLSFLFLASCGTPPPGRDCATLRAIQRPASASCGPPARWRRPHAGSAARRREHQQFPSSPSADRLPLVLALLPVRPSVFSSRPKRRKRSRAALGAVCTARSATLSAQSYVDRFSQSILDRPLSHTLACS